MVDAGIGRLLISSLHQGIADVAPSRLDFYETWLSPTGIRDGRLAMAPLGAVLSFVHREAPPANHEIPARAGMWAANWTYQELSSLRQWYIRRLPIRLRSRAALRLGRRLVMSTVSNSKVRTRKRRRRAVVEIRSELFTQLRDPSTFPMRGFYAAALQRLFAHCCVNAEVTVSGQGPQGWRLAVAIKGSSPRIPVDAA